MSIENKVKFCTNCGGELKPGAKFCTNCGAKVEYPAVNEEAAAAPVEETEIPEAAAEPVEEPAAQEEAPAVEPAVEAADEPAEPEAADEPAEPEAKADEPAQQEDSGMKSAAFGAAAAGAAAAGAAFGGGFSGNDSNAGANAGSGYSQNNYGAGNNGAYNGGYNDYNNNYSNNGSYGTAPKEKYDPNIIECFILFFKNYVNFKGRTGRREYWLTVLALMIPSIVLSILSSVLVAISYKLSAVGTGLTGIYGLAIFIPGIALSVRRLHDRDKSGLFYLFNLIPLVGSIILFVWYLMAGTPGENRFGDIERYEELADKNKNMTLEEKKKSKKVIFIVIGIIVAVIIAIIAIGAIYSGHHTESGAYSSDSYSDGIYDSEYDDAVDIDDDIDSTPAPVTGSFDKSSAASYVGTWNAEKAGYSGISMDISEIFGDGVSMVFKNDGIMQIIVEGDVTNGTWRLDGDDLIIDGAEAYDIEYDDGYLVMDVEGVELYFKKVN